MNLKQDQSLHTSIINHRFTQTVNHCGYRDKYEKVLLTGFRVRANVVLLGQM